jgi:hypothetical protein
MSSPLELHVWQLQQVGDFVYSLDPNCLATLLALQLLLPGQFSIVADNTPDNSPSGAPACSVALGRNEQYSYRDITIPQRWS